MKKHKFHYLVNFPKRAIKTTMFLLVLTVVFYSCNEDLPEDNRDITFNLDKYFTIDNGFLSFQEFPDTSQVDEAPAVDSVYGEQIIPEGGQNQMNVIMSAPTQSIVVGVAGETYGFYQVFAPETGPVTEFAIDFVFTEDDYRNVYYIKVAGIDEDGNVGIADSIKVMMIDAAFGIMQVTCEWDQLVDIDLYLQEPNGDTVYYDNPVSGNLGYLDMDSNPFCWLDSVNAETITYDENAVVEAGTYRVLMRYLSNCDVQGPVEYTITVVFEGDTINLADSGNPFTGNLGYEETFINPKEMFTFTIASDTRKSTTIAQQRWLRFGYDDGVEHMQSLSPEKSEWETMQERTNR